MIFRIVLIMFFTNVYQAFSLEYACKFEEVYIDGYTQQGLVLIKKDNLRYQYFDKNLFTIIHKNGDTSLSKNNNRKEVSSVEEENNLINHIIRITKDYPFFEKDYQINDFKFIVENSSKYEFIKRLAIVSDNLNLSIYFQNCRSLEILDLYFQHNPYFEYSFK